MSSITIFSLFPVSSISFTLAYSAPATSIASVLFQWKKMPFITMCFPSIFCSWPSTSKNVIFLRNSLKMFWITTKTVITYMIKLIFGIPSSWYWFNKPRINKSMNELNFSIVPNISITRQFCTSPNPTFSLKFYSFYHCLKGTCFQILNRKKLVGVVHMNIISWMGIPGWGKMEDFLSG